MKHACPHCGKDLAWKLVKSKALAGERGFLSNKAAAAFPSCQGQISLNTHWSEIILLGFVGIPFFFFPEIRSILGRTGSLYALAGIIIFGGATALFFHLRYWRHWQRYKPFSVKKITH